MWPPETSQYLGRGLPSGIHRVTREKPERRDATVGFGGGGGLRKRPAIFSPRRARALSPPALARYVAAKGGGSMVAATDSATRDDDGKPRWRARWAVFSLGMGAPGAKRPPAGHSTASVRTGQRDSRGPPMRARRGQARQGWRGRT